MYCTKIRHVLQNETDLLVNFSNHDLQPISETSLGSKLLGEWPNEMADLTIIILVEMNSGSSSSSSFISVLRYYTEHFCTTIRHH
jgi:hypothetical protein